jgi:hypothetical protein
MPTFKDLFVDIINDHVILFSWVVFVVFTSYYNEYACATRPINMTMHPIKAMDLHFASNFANNFITYITQFKYTL